MAVANSSGSVSPKAFTGNGAYTWTVGSDSPVLILNPTGTVDLTFSGLVNGATGKIIVTQDATGNRLINFVNAYNYLGNYGVCPIPNSVSILDFFFNNNTLYFSGNRKEESEQFNNSETSFSASMTKKRTLLNLGGFDIRNVSQVVWSPNTTGTSNSTNRWTLNLYAKIAGVDTLLTSLFSDATAVGDNVTIIAIPSFNPQNWRQLLFEVIKTGTPGNLVVGEINVFFQSQY